MTRHLPDEIAKGPISMEDTDLLITRDTLLNNTLNVSHQIVRPNISSTNKIPVKTIAVKNRTKQGFIKSRLGKIMHKLYDLELDATPEKPLNIDLCVDLYQMENF